MRVTVCELRTSPDGLEQDWEGLVAHVRDQRSELVVLPELGFAPWFSAGKPDDRVWAQAVAAHAAWVQRLPELRAAVLGTRPVDRAAGRRNEAYAARDGAVTGLHDKSYLPDEDGFREAAWYGRGDGGHRVHEVGDLRVGVLVCTEMWFLEHAARAYGRAGAHVVAVPRVTPAYSLDKWLAGGRTCAVVSGTWSLSSNSAEPEHGGLGWVVDPDGEVVATTSRDEPWVTVDIELAAADAAKSTYPRYVPDL